MKVIVMPLFFSPRSRSAIFGLTLCLTAGLNSLAMAAPSAAEKAKIDKANDNTFAALTFLSTVCLQENEKNAELPLGKALMGNADFKKWFDSAGENFHACVKQKKPLPDAFCAKLLGLKPNEDPRPTLAELEKEMPKLQAGLQATVKECEPANVPPAANKKK